MDFPTLGKIGFVSSLDLPPHQLPIGAWNESINIRFRDGAAERFQGQQQIFTDPSVTPYYLQPYNRNGARWWIHAGIASIYADDGTTRRNLTPAAPPTGAIDDRWTGGTLTGISILNNGVDAPWSWDGGAGLFIPLVNWQAGVRVRSLRPFGQFLVGLDVTNPTGRPADRYPHMVKWSCPAEPGALPATWDQTDLTNIAGEFDLSARPGVLVDQLELDTANIIYKEGSIIRMVATGDNKVFDFTQVISSTHGALARGCVGNTPMGHVVLTNGDVVLHTGTAGSVKSIIDGRTRKWLFKSIDSTQRARCFVCVNPPANEVWICFPELGKTVCTMALVWNWLADTWQPRQIPNATYAAAGPINYDSAGTWAAQTITWGDASLSWNENPFSAAQDRLLMCNTSPRVDVIDNSATFNNVPFTSSMTRTGITCGSPLTRKQTLTLVPNIDAAVGTKVRIELGAHAKVNEPVKWATPFDFTVGTHEIVPRVASGHFLAMRYTSLDNQQWRVRDAQLEYFDLGRN